MPPRENVPTSYAGCPLQRSPSDPITFDGITPSTRTAFWWRNFLPSWKGRSFFYDDKWTRNHILIFTPTYASLASVLISQATGSTGHPRPRRPLYRSVMFKELFAITAAVYTWAASFACRNILLHCDSLPVVHILSRGSRKCKHVMTLLRFLFYTCAHHNILLRGIHIDGVDNHWADGSGGCRP